jgi:hypothetical protein
MTDKPCCAEAAARKIKHLMIDGIPIGLSQLDEIMDEIKRMGLQSENEIGDALLKKVSIFNYVPSSASSEYESALVEEYECRYPKMS